MVLSMILKRCLDGMSICNQNRPWSTAAVDPDDAHKSPFVVTAWKPRVVQKAQEPSFSSGRQNELGLRDLFALEILTQKRVSLRRFMVAQGFHVLELDPGLSA